MTESQRRRWAAVRAESDKRIHTTARKRKLSAEGRKRMAEAATKLWVVQKATKAGYERTLAEAPAGDGPPVTAPPTRFTVEIGQLGKYLPAKGSK